MVLLANMEMSEQHADNDFQHSMIHCMETSNLFLVNMLPSVNDIKYYRLIIYFFMFAINVKIWLLFKNS